MHSTDTNGKFLELRAKGWSLARIATQIAGNDHFSHFGPEANLLEELETLFHDYGNTGTGKNSASCAQLSWKPCKRRSWPATKPNSPAWPGGWRPSKSSYGKRIAPFLHRFCTACPAH